ncbi:hypothetical protein TMCBR2_gp018 [Caulobacter phage TMCBR2]|uniref:DUF6950 domain-containing protein n=1 Tax=Caulobacter phage TMCBR2 TaxID=3025404 RepID=A0AAE9YJQ1_9CAUD|nr:hypothetical protein TMCBR2_gp018 [Caulobacter phage TMCBR2]WDS38266.1 hypothetical protein TMCBR3_gp018 [Caulobacter phage TMCBR3]
MTTLLSRAEIAQAAVDRFNLKPFAWGERDCAQLAKFALMRAGHPNPLKGGRSYRGELGAVRALAFAVQAFGLPKNSDLAAVLDAMGLPRIAPAQALPGDIVGLHGPAPFGVALSIAVGNNKALGFAPDPEADGLPRCYVGEMLVEVDGVVAAATAWRVNPCR